MRIWNIDDESSSNSIEMDSITVLKKQDISWYHLVRKVDNFFNDKTSDIKIYEDTQLINKKDWLCYFIPFDAQVQLDKITSKSPLKDIQNYASEQLTYSPFFQEIQDVWEQLNDELQLVNQSLKSIGITASLKEFETKNINNFLTFQSFSEEMTPVEYKQLLLNLALRSEMDKKILLIIELPELYTTSTELENFLQLINDAVKKGYTFLLVTNKNLDGSINYIYQNTIINNAVLDQMKFKIMKELPFYCSEEMYEEAKMFLFQAVDNSITFEEIKKRASENYGAIVTIINVLMYNINVELSHDLAGIEPNLKKFIERYK